jgi:hypothetical protein
MPVIDPTGLFQGQRLAACSDLAQLYWPRLYSAANGYGRLELHLPSIISRCFRTFHQPPTEGQLWAIFEEYVANYLAMPYRADGHFWLLFMTEDKYLKNYKTHEDEQSPAPSKASVDKFKKQYTEWKSNRPESQSPNGFTNLSEIFQKSFGELSEEFSHGIGVGVGVGEGKGDGDDDEKQSQQRSSSSSFSLLLVQGFWNLHRGPMRESLRLTAYQHRLFAARVRQGFTQQVCEQVISKMAATPYFCGEANGVLANLTWLLDTNKKTGEPNFQNVLDGDYEPRKPSKKTIAKAQRAPSYKDLAHHG